MSSQDSSLPPHWEARFDPKSQKWFYVNHSTKTTTWTDPRSSSIYSRSSLRSMQSKAKRSTPSSQESEKNILSTPIDDKITGRQSSSSSEDKRYRDRKLSDNASEKILHEIDSLRAILGQAYTSKHSVSAESETTESLPSSSVPKLNSPETTNVAKRHPPLSTVTSATCSSSNSGQTGDHRVESYRNAKGVLERQSAIDSLKIEIDGSAYHGSGHSSDIYFGLGNEREIRNITVNHRDTESGYITIDSSVKRIKPSGPDTTLRCIRVCARGPNKNLVNGPESSLPNGSMKRMIAVKE